MGAGHVGDHEARSLVGFAGQLARRFEHRRDSRPVLVGEPIGVDELDRRRDDRIADGPQLELVDLPRVDVTIGSSEGDLLEPGGHDDDLVAELAKLVEYAAVAGQPSNLAGVARRRGIRRPLVDDVKDVAHVHHRRQALSRQQIVRPAGRRDLESTGLECGQERRLVVAEYGLELVHPGMAVEDEEEDVGRARGRGANRNRLTKRHGTLAPKRPEIRAQ